MSLKAKLEAIIYAAETPITLDHIFQLVKESVINDGASDEAEAKSRVRATLDDLVADYSAADHGVEIRQVAGGYRMSTKPEHHDVVRMFAKSLKPPIRLSLPALETLAVIAYKQPVTVPEINERPQANHDRRPKSSRRTSHPLPEHKRIPAALWAQRRHRTTKYGGI